MAPYGGTIEAREVSTNVDVRRTTGRSRSIASGGCRGCIDIDVGGLAPVPTDGRSRRHFCSLGPAGTSTHYCSATSMQNYRGAQW
jgi:hypothetical protein